MNFEVSGLIKTVQPMNSEVHLKTGGFALFLGVLVLKDWIRE